MAVPTLRRSRERLVRATVEVSASAGFHAISVSGLARAAGVRPRTFYNNFADLSDVFFEACWEVHEDLRSVVQAAYDGAAEGPRDRATACVGAVVAFIQADPARARVLFVEGYAGGPAVAGLRAETVEWLVGLVDGRVGRRRGAGHDRRRLLAELAVGGINAVLTLRIKAGDPELDGLVAGFVDTLLRSRGGAARSIGAPAEPR